MAWLLTLAIVVVTVCPINFRPTTGLPAELERFAAFGLVGLMFGLAYPRHRLVAMAAIVVGAAELEAAQNFLATRHGRIEDFEIKALAGALGALSSIILGEWSRSRRIACSPGARSPSRSAWHVAGELKPALMTGGIYSRVRELPHQQHATGGVIMAHATHADREDGPPS
jgi:hypothetical protein